MRKSFKANLKATMETIVTITLATLCMCVFCQPAHAATETLLDSITKVESTSTGTLYTFNDGTGYYSENFAAPTLKYSMNGNYYPLTGIITSIAPDSDSRENVITLECGNGNMFQFTDSIDATGTHMILYLALWTTRELQLYMMMKSLQQCMQDIQVSSRRLKEEIKYVIINKKERGERKCSPFIKE